MKDKGINLEDIIASINSENVDVALDLIAKRIEFINGDELFISLKETAEHWKGSYENLKEEEIEWNEINAEESYHYDDNEKLYGGLSDDWEEYLDMIHHDK
jgi:hypothetical protein